MLMIRLLRSLSFSSCEPGEMLVLVQLCSFDGVQFFLDNLYLYCVDSRPAFFGLWVPCQVDLLFFLLCWIGLNLRRLSFVGREKGCGGSYSRPRESCRAYIWNAALQRLGYYAGSGQMFLGGQLLLRHDWWLVPFVTPTCLCPETVVEIEIAGPCSVSTPVISKKSLCEVYGFLSVILRWVVSKSMMPPNSDRNQSHYEQFVCCFSRVLFLTYRWHLDVHLVAFWSVSSSILFIPKQVSNSFLDKGSADIFNFALVFLLFFAANIDRVWTYMYLIQHIFNLNDGCISMSSFILEPLIWTTIENSSSSITILSNKSDLFESGWITVMVCSDSDIVSSNLSLLRVNIIFQMRTLHSRKVKFFGSCQIIPNYNLSDTLISWKRWQQRFIFFFSDSFKFIHVWKKSFTCFEQTSRVTVWFPFHVTQIRRCSVSLSHHFIKEKDDKWAFTGQISRNQTEKVQCSLSWMKSPWISIHLWSKRRQAVHTADRGSPAVPWGESHRMSIHRVRLESGAFHNFFLWWISSSICHCFYILSYIFSFTFESPTWHHVLHLRSTAIFFCRGYDSVTLRFSFTTPWASLMSFSS